MPARRLGLAWVVTLAAMLVTFDVRAAFEFRDDGWEGTSELLELARQQLGKERVQLVAALDYGSLKPEDGIIILHPQNRLDYDELAAFLRAGGRLALVDDHGRGSELLTRFQIHRINAPLRPRNALRSNSNLAIAEPSVRSSPVSNRGGTRLWPTSTG